MGLFVCIAGNANTNIDNYPKYPGSFENSNIITVGATDNTDARASFVAQTVPKYVSSGNVNEVAYEE